MKWTDNAVILSCKKFSESSLIVTLFTKERGLHRGLVRGVKKNLATCQTGNIVHARWQSRLEEQLGNLTLELTSNIAIHIFDDNLRLCALSSICSLINRTFPERDAYEELFVNLLKFLSHLIDGNNQYFLQEYIELELCILSNLGYGLDVGKCAAGGNDDDLFYISPKTGRSVSLEFGRQYHSKLLKLPEFLKPQYINNSAQNHDILAQIIDGIKLTDYFLDKYVFSQQISKMPEARKRFVNRLQKLGN